jgi:hypothetical protein
MCRKRGNLMIIENSEAKSNPCNVTVFDTPMGGGKSTYNLQELRKSTQSTMLVVPTLDEAERCIGVLSNFITVELGGKHKTKTSRLIECITQNLSVIITHALFDLISNNIEIISLLEDSDYRLDFDENLNSVSSVQIPKDDIQLMLKHGYIDIVRSGKLQLLKWLDNDSDSILNKYKPIIAGRNIAIIKNTCVDIYSKRLLQAFTGTWIYTYMFDASYHRCLLDLYGIEYKKRSIVKNSCGDGYLSVPYKAVDGSGYQDLVNVLSHKKLNERWDECTLSLTELRDASTEDFKTMQKDLINLYKNIFKGHGKGFMWTIFEDQMVNGRKKKIRSSVESKVFATIGRILIDDSELEIKLKTTHVAVNSKGTNDYIDRSALAYMVGRYCNPSIARFFSYYEINVDTDAYSLSELLQWIWRSQIRRGDNIYIYIASTRMRNLFTNWLNKSKEIAANDDSHQLNQYVA